MYKYLRTSTFSSSEYMFKFKGDLSLSPLTSSFSLPPFLPSPFLSLLFFLPLCLCFYLCLSLSFFLFLFFLSLPPPLPPLPPLPPFFFLNFIIITRPGACATVCVWRSENTSMQSVLYSLCESQSLKSGHRACIVSAFSELSCWPHAFLFVFFFKVYLPTYPLTLCWPWNRTAPPHSPAPAPPYSLAPSTTRPLPTVPALPTARPLPTVRLLPQPDPSLQLGSSHNPAPPIA